MTIAPHARPGFHLDRTAGCLVLVNAGLPGGLSLYSQRRREVWLARLQHRSLDSRLAAGELPENSVLLAVRATQLVGTAARRRLASRWDALAVEARRLTRAHHDIAADIQQVADVLRQEQSLAVRGIATATTTLGVAADAVHHASTGGAEVAVAAARTAVAAM